MPCPVCAQRHGDTPNLNNGSNKEKPSDHVLVAGAEFNKMADELCNGPSIAIEVRAENAVQTGYPLRGCDVWSSAALTQPSTATTHLHVNTTLACMQHHPGLTHLPSRMAGAARTRRPARPRASPGASAQDAPRSVRRGQGHERRALHRLTRGWAAGDGESQGKGEREGGRERERKRVVCPRAAECPAVVTWSVCGHGRQ
eukprot:144656-Rhodomonas_salina.6